MQTNEVLQTREEWLDEHNVREWDVMLDNEDREYIVYEEDNGTAGEPGYEVRTVKLLLPKFKK